MDKRHMAWLSIACTAALVAGCASTRDHLHSSIGQPADQLVQALGQPDADFRLQTGERVLQWEMVSTRNEPKIVFTERRRSYLTSVRSHAVPDDLPRLTGRAFNNEDIVVEACVVWALIGPDGNIQKGAAHGSGC